VRFKKNRFTKNQNKERRGKTEAKLEHPGAGSRAGDDLEVSASSSSSSSSSLSPLFLYQQEEKEEEEEEEEWKKVKSKRVVVWSLLVAVLVLVVVVVVSYVVVSVGNGNSDENDEEDEWFIDQVIDDSICVECLRGASGDGVVRLDDCGLVGFSFAPLATGMKGLHNDKMQYMGSGFVDVIILLKHVSSDYLT